MWKFIVSWVVVQVVQVPCPDGVKNVQYGAASYQVACAVNHCKIETTRHERSFMSKDSAIRFIREGKALVDTFYLDSVKVQMTGHGL